MTTTQLQLRRDTTANIGAITPAQGEPIYDVTRKALVLGDGATAGGNCATPFSGTWTPQLQFGGANTGMTGTFSGTWTQVGNLVFFAVLLTLTAKGSATGAATITGLPVASGSFGGQVNIGYFGPLATTPNPVCFIGEGATITLGKTGAETWAALADTDFDNDSVIDVCGFYFAAQPTG